MLTYADILDTFHEHLRRGGGWVAGFDAWGAIQRMQVPSGEYLFNPLTGDFVPTVFGIPIRTDDTLPPGMLQLRDVTDRVLAEIRV